MDQPFNDQARHHRTIEPWASDRTRAGTRHRASDRNRDPLSLAHHPDHEPTSHQPNGHFHALNHDRRPHREPGAKRGRPRPNLPPGIAANVGAQSAAGDSLVSAT